MTGVRFPQGTQNVTVRHNKRTAGEPASRNTAVLFRTGARIINLLYKVDSRLDKAQGVIWADTCRWISTELSR
jgi:hypothetical protein